MATPPRKKSPKPARAADACPEETSPGESGHELDGLIWDLGRAYYAYVGLVERVLVEQGLDDIIRPGMGLVLFALYEEDRRTIKELSGRSRLACSTLTGLLTRMEKAGLIVRKRDADDGRLVRVTLTPLGRRLESKCRAMAQRMTNIAHRGVGSQNVAQAKLMLQGFTAAFRLEEQRLAEVQSAARSATDT